MNLPPPRPDVSLATLRSIKWPIRPLGPYSAVFGFILLGCLCLGISRAALIWWQWDRVEVTDALFSMMLQGLRSDLITLGVFAVPAVLLLPVFLAGGRMKLWTRLSSAWLAGSLITIAFLELATPQFLIEYDSRPNRLFVEYLIYPQEVFAMLWHGYRGLLSLIAAGIAVLCWLVIRHFRKYSATADSWSARRLMLVWPLLVILLFVMIRSSVQHRPANLASFAFSDDAMVNSLVTNSAYRCYRPCMG